MFYKGYEGRYDFDPDEGVYIGSIQGIDHFVRFYGETPDELERDFKAQVDSYIAYFKSSN